MARSKNIERTAKLVEKRWIMDSFRSNSDYIIDYK